MERGEQKCCHGKQRYLRTSNNFISLVFSYPGDIIDDDRREMEIIKRIRMAKNILNKMKSILTSRQTKHYFENVNHLSFLFFLLLA